MLVVTCHGKYSPQVLKRFSPFLQASAKGNQIQHILDFFVRYKENRNITEEISQKEKMITTKLTACHIIARLASYEQVSNFKLGPCLNSFCLRSQKANMFTKISEPQKTE